jgi:hypothetical protein
VPWLMLQTPDLGRTSLVDHHPNDGGLGLIKTVLEVLLLLWPSSQVRRVSGRGGAVAIPNYSAVTGGVLL